MTAEQADILFDALHSSNVQFKTRDYENILQRGFWDVFISQQYGGSWSYQYAGEVKQLILLITYVTKKKGEQIRKLFGSLPFWDPQYLLLSDKIREIDPRMYFDSWKELIITENELISKNSRWPYKVPKPSERTISSTLVKMKELELPEFDEFLISLINHYSLQIRKTIQTLLGEKFPRIPKG